MDKTAAQRLASLEELLEHAIVGVVQTDAEGKMVAVNPCWCKMLGYSEAEMLRLSVADVTHPESLAETLAAVQRLAAGGAAFRLDKRYLRKDGSTLWARSSVSAIRDEDGTFRGLTAVVVDISDRKRAEDALRAGQGRQAFLLALGDALRPLADPLAVRDEAARVLGQHLQASRVHYAEWGPDGEVSVHSGHHQGVAAVAGRHPPPSFGAAFLAELRAGRSFAVGDVARDPRLDAELRAVWQGLDVGAVVCVPLVKEGRLAATLSVHHRETHAWDAEEIAIVEEVATRTWDAVERARAEKALRESEAMLRATFEQATVGIVHVGAGGRFLRVNRKFCEMLGYEAAELVRMGFADITVDEDRDRGLAEFREVNAGRRRGFTTEKRYRRRDGSVIWVRITASAVGDAQSGAFGYHLALVEDITEQREAEQRARDAAQHDPLTRLPNRRLVFEYAGHLLAATARQHRQGAFLFIDLDRFKPVNDLYGHEVGDRLLEEVARRLLACVRHEDLVGRLGGDEFVIVLPYLEAPHHAVTVAHHVIERVSAPVSIRELTVSVSPSIGISHFPQHGQDADALIRAADLAMYRAKQAGAGGYEVYTPGLAQQAHHMSLLEARLKRAMQRRSLELHYQPVVDMRTGRPSGAEALLRIIDDDGSVIAPARFIPVAEAAGLIGQLGEWVAAEACRQHAAWLAQGLPPIPVAVNVSPLQFRQPDFAQRLCDIVRDSGIDPACFQIEVTESTVMDSVSEGIEKLRLLRASGITVALDDFGTGYSSLSHLSQLPLDRLKVDQSFVRGIGHDRASRAITDAVIALGRTLDLEVVGEGVESDEACAYLREQGCDKGQGYLFSPPMRGEEFAAWFCQP